LTTERRHQDTLSDGSTERLPNSQYMVADANGTITTTFATDGLASGNYSIVMHGATNGHETVIPFTIN